MIHHKDVVSGNTKNQKDRYEVEQGELLVSCHDVDEEERGGEGKQHANRCRTDERYAPHLHVEKSKHEREGADGPQQIMPQCCHHLMRKEVVSLIPCDLDMSVRRLIVTRQQHIIVEFEEPILARSLTTPFAAAEVVRSGVLARGLTRTEVLIRPPNITTPRQL